MKRIATVSLYEAKTQLSHLGDRAMRGDEVLITRHGRPVARLVPARTARVPRKLGALRGRIRVRADFDAPLPDEVLGLFEGRRS
jgi:prevent-host-death family protein